MSKRGAEAFGQFLANFIAHSGKYPDPTSLARAASVSPSAVSRYINGKERPSVPTLEKLAPLLGATVAELVAIAYPENLAGARPAQAVEVDEDLAELAAMLSPESPLNEDDRDYIRTMVNRVKEPYRSKMRRARRRRSA